MKKFICHNLKLIIAALVCLLSLVSCPIIAQTENSNPLDPFQQLNIIAKVIPETLNPVSPNTNPEPLLAATQNTSIPASLDKTISMDFQDIPVRQALKLLTDEAGINLVINDNVTGTISLQLHNIQLRKVLDIILKTKRLISHQIGNVLIISPTSAYIDQQKNELAANKEISELAPLQSILIKLQYANATDIAALLKSPGNTILSSRGSVSVDTRTNSLWLQDISSKLEEIQRLVAQLDIPVRQVLISARIVTVDDSYSRELGIRFGVSSKPTQLSGTLTGANQLASGTIETPAVTLKDRLNFDAVSNKMTGLFTQPASIGLAAAEIGGSVMLDMELRAMEDENIINVIASPRLIISHSQSGIIETGTEIPYEEKTSSGATSITFKKAVLSLNVTPFISANNRIMLNLIVHQDKFSASTGSLSTNTIDTNQLSTQIWVDNNQTVVLGGIYQRTKTNHIQRVPFFSSIPLLGNLFKYRQQSDSRKELLIFITPKIINPSKFD